MSDNLHGRVKRALEALTIESYIKRGRRHASADTVALRQAWPEALRVWLEARTESSENAEEDIRAELLMRGVEVSMSDAGEAGAKMLAEIKGREPDFEDMAEHPAIREVLAKMDEKPN